MVNIIFCRLIPESPRWLLVKGRSQKAEEILQKTARLNKAKLPHNLFEKHVLESNQTTPIWAICKHPRLVLECVIITNNW